MTPGPIDRTPGIPGSDKNCLPGIVYFQVKKKMGKKREYCLCVYKFDNDVCCHSLLLGQGDYWGCCSQLLQGLTIINGWMGGWGTY